MLQVDLDLDSSTQKNGENIQERMIKEGDTVTINTKEGEKILNIIYKNINFFKFKKKKKKKNK